MWWLLLQRPWAVIKNKLSWKHLNEKKIVWHLSAHVTVFINTYKCRHKDICSWYLFIFISSWQCLWTTPPLIATASTLIVVLTYIVCAWYWRATRGIFAFWKFSNECEMGIFRPWTLLNSQLLVESGKYRMLWQLANIIHHRQ